VKALGFQLVARDYYSPVPDLDQLPPEVWTRPSALGGITFDLGGQRRFLEQKLGPYLPEFRPRRTASSDPAQFHLANGFYTSVEAETLYAMIRWLKPQHVVELGSGFSTLVMAAACAANQADGHPVDYRAYNPFPSAQITRAVAAGLTGLTEHAALSATEVPDSVMAQLGRGDVLFVDTTHTVKIGGDVNRVVLDVLPTLPAGVTVHFHDIFLPWEYPRSWVVDSERYWAEQYLLQAFLAGNSAWEVLLATFALTRDLPQEIASLIDSFDLATERPGSPAAFWIRHR
jgi:Methyltransferase domain